MAKDNNATPKKLSSTCICCGTRNQSSFYTSRDKWHNAMQKIPYCKDCIGKIYDYYLKKYNGNYNMAMYYCCRKIDIPYIHSVYQAAVEMVQNPDSQISGMENIIPAYFKIILLKMRDNPSFCFDDSKDENLIDGLTTFEETIKVRRKTNNAIEEDADYEIIEIDSDDLVNKWGHFSDDDLAFLESEYMDWDEQMSGISDKATDISVKQICLQVNQIRHMRENSDQGIDKALTTLRQYMKDTGLNTVSVEDQKKRGVGMSAQDIEYHRPVKTVNKQLQDVDDIGMIVSGFLGGTSRALGKENKFTQDFDAFYDKYTVGLINKLQSATQSESEENAEKIVKELKRNNGKDEEPQKEVKSDG